MEAVFLKLLNMSITAGWMIVAVLVLRVILKKAPKWLHCLLWGLVGIRLVCPLSLQSIFSLIPSSETVPSDIAAVRRPVIDSGISAVNKAVNPVLSSSFSPQAAADVNSSAVNPMRYLVAAAAAGWLAGVFALLLYAFISFLKLKRSVSAAVPVRGNVMACDEIGSPFILGVFKPIIYIPSSLQAQTAECVIEHEQAHLKRRDHFWKPLGYLLLTVYWFNPLCWVAYALLCRDIESACDEKVIRGKDKEHVAAYSQALLDCSFQRKRITACPLAFGEVGVKQRVIGVLNYKKPAFWVVLAAVAVCVVVSACLMTDPVTGKRLPNRLGISMDMAIAEHNRSKKTQTSFTATAYDVLAVAHKPKQTVVYADVQFAEYSFNGINLREESAFRSPVAVVFDTASAKDDVSSYDELSYLTPREGGDYESDLRETFPLSARLKLWRKSLRAEKENKLHENCLRAAKEYFGLDPEGLPFVVPEDAASASVRHTLGSQSVEKYGADLEFAQLKLWLSGLRCREASFEAGKTPGDANGAELYEINLFSVNDIASYTYVKTGDGAFLLAGQVWYSVTEPSDPPVDFDTMDTFTFKYAALLSKPEKGLASLSKEALAQRIKALEEAIADVTKNGNSDKDRQNDWLLNLQLAKIETQNVYFARTPEDASAAKKCFWSMQKLCEYYTEQCELHGKELNKAYLEIIVSQLDCLAIGKDAAGDGYRLMETGGFISTYYVNVSELSLRDFYWYYPPSEYITEPEDILSFLQNNTQLNYTAENIVTPLSLIDVNALNETLLTHAEISADDLEPNWRYRFQSTSNGEYLLSWVSDVGPHVFRVDRGYINNDSGVIYLFGSKEPYDFVAGNKNADRNDLLIGCLINGARDFAFISFLPSPAREF